MEPLLKALRENAALTPRQLAAMFAISEDDVSARIKFFEAEHIILGYRTILNEEKLGVDTVRALIEVKIPRNAKGDSTESRKGLPATAKSALLSDVGRIRSAGRDRGKKSAGSCLLCGGETGEVGRSHFHRHPFHAQAYKGAGDPHDARARK